MDTAARSVRPFPVATNDSACPTHAGLGTVTKSHRHSLGRLAAVVAAIGRGGDGKDVNLTSTKLHWAVEVGGRKARHRYLVKLVWRS
eukprot:gene10877-biopygen7764